ncbi:MAG: hypothetical protein ACT4PV_02740 [Planctomycetaceae bacterium]
MSPPAPPGSRSVSRGAGALTALLGLALLGVAEGEEPSYYLRRIRPSGIEVDDMTPTIVSPLPTEIVPEACPERLVVVCGKRGYADSLRPYLAALGLPGFGAIPAEGLAGEVAAALEATWKLLAKAAEGEPTAPPLRVLIKHYPQELPAGPCFTLHVTFFTVPDPHLEGDEATRAEGPSTDRKIEERSVPGAWFDIRATYLLKAGERRLLEASCEATTRVRRPARAPRLAQLLQEKSIEPLGADERGAAHFELYAGDRAGFAWFDRSWGVGASDPWAVAYRAPWRPMGEPPSSERATLPAALLDRLLAFVRRA